MVDRRISGYFSIYKPTAPFVRVLLRLVSGFLLINPHDVNFSVFHRRFAVCEVFLHFHTSYHRADYNINNDISLVRYDRRQYRMIYLLRKHDIISVPHMTQAYIIARQCDIISKIYHPFHKERISLKKVTFVGRQK